MPIRKSNGMIGAKENEMKLKDAITQLEEIKAGDVDGLNTVIRRCEARFHLSRLGDADWSEWDRQIDAHIRRVYAVAMVL